MTQSNSYRYLSKFYDRLNYDCDYNKWSQYLFDLIEKHGCGRRGADAACGSGNITIRLKKAGLDVFGFDISEGMLNAALENSLKQGENIEFVKADMVTFKSFKALDFICCANDAINYVSFGDIKRCFKNLYKNLKTGGLLLFDISSAYKLKNIIGNATFSDDTADVTYIWNNHLEGDKVFMDLIIFQRQGGNYLRFDENHIQYIYEAGQVGELLKSAGFKKVFVYDFLTYNPPKNTSQRLQFAAIK